MNKYQRYKIARDKRKRILEVIEFARELELNLVKYSFKDLKEHDFSEIVTKPKEFEEFANNYLELPHIGSQDVYLLDRGYLLEDSLDNTIKVGDLLATVYKDKNTNKNVYGEIFEAYVFADVVSVGTFVFSRKDGKYYPTSEVVKITIGDDN